MAYYKDLREHLKALEERGKLVRISSPINKDTQLHPVVRLQYRGLPEEARKAFVFTNTFDSRGRKYTTPVTVCALAGSSEIYAIGMMCSPDKISERLAQAQLSPIEPRLVARGPAQEEVHVGSTLLEHGGLDEFPIPISTPGFDTGPFFTAGSWITKDPDTGVRNVGVYRGEVKSPTRVGSFFGAVNRHALEHWRKCKERGVPLQAAIVIGGPPSIGYVGVSRLPTGVDELTVAGGIAGEPLELVKCRTVDLEVPAYAEIVIEGEMMTDELEVEAPFGEATGFLGMTEVMPYLNIKCITHRKQPVWVSWLSQFPPSESSKIRQYANEAMMYKYLKHDKGLAAVQAVAFHESAASEALMTIQVKKSEQGEVWRVLEEAGKRYLAAKTIIAVDADINLRDIDAVNWAIAYRVQAHRDCRIIKFPTPNLLDPSLEAFEDLERRRHKEYDANMERPEASQLLINATLKWAYPPVSLPRKEFMDEALRIWEKEGLPELKLKEPWWGYDLEYWGEEHEMWARRAVRGEYYLTGEERTKNRIKV